MLEALGGRKFLLTLIVLAVGTAVQILKPEGVNESFVALLVGISATFSAANAFTTKAMAGVAGASEAPVETEPLMVHVPAQPPVDLSPIENRLNQLEAITGQVIESQTKIVENLQGVDRVAKSALIAAGRG